MFAAYSGTLRNEPSPEKCSTGDKAGEPDWLANSSFAVTSSLLVGAKDTETTSRLSHHHQNDVGGIGTHTEEGDNFEDREGSTVGASPGASSYQIYDLSSEDEVLSSRSPRSDQFISSREERMSSTSKKKSIKTSKEKITKKQRSESSGIYSRKKSSRRSSSPPLVNARSGKDRSRDQRKSQRRSRELRKFRRSSSEDSDDQNGDPLRTKERTVHATLGTFYEDKDRDFGNFKVVTLSRPNVALYRSSWKVLGLRNKSQSSASKRKTLKYRYYNRVLKVLEEELQESEKRKSTDVGGSDISKGVDTISVEEELSKATAQFNRDLTAEPQDVDMWLKYVKFQDTIHQFELIHRKGGGAAGIRVTAERKLSILDKALDENPSNHSLLKERCQLAENVLSSDKLSLELKSLIEKDLGNLVLWKALIMASQGSLSTCQVPAVKSLYQEALKSIHSLRRGNKEPVVLLESKLLDVVFHLGLFLRQSGLLELMWSLVHVYLEFNLAKLDSTKFNISSTVADNALTELEEAILGSQMPLPTLWLRVEALRAGTHWVSLPADAVCEDPQRLVFPEDINDLIHPISIPHLSFRLVTITLTLLKVPLLPWRQTVAEVAGLYPLPWLLDGPEPLFASLMPLGTLEFRETSAVLSDAAQLVCGPQYLIARPGQDEYIDFLTQVFSACSSCLPTNQQTYLLVWWLRFYRWLTQLERMGHCKLPRGRKKKMRSTAKDILRQESNRSNLLLFKEFALLEWETSNSDGAKKVLQGAIDAQPSSKPVPFSDDRAALCSLYRTLVELHLSYIQISDPQGEGGNSVQVENMITVEDREKALLLLVSLGRGISLRDKKVSGTDITAALSKFDHISRELVGKPLEVEVEQSLAAEVCHIAPSFLSEWTACYGWLLFLSDSIWKAATMFETVLTGLASRNDTAFDSAATGCEESLNATLVLKIHREAVFEGYVSLLRHHCHETSGSFAVLRDVLLRALKEFPGNLTLLAAFADLETTITGAGLPSWRLSKIFMEIDSAQGYALFVFVMRHRLKQQEVAARKAAIFLGHGGPEVPNPNMRSRMSTLLKKLTKHPVMRRCPLLWRLRLQFAAAFSNKDSDYHNTFYLALEECPWAKALYMDIVQVLPMQLAQVQDLLIEKELRLHVTPEELEILRIDQ